jgi:methionyl-tRNA formyltransferase
MKIVFMGTPQAAVPSLEKLVQAGHEIAAVYTQPDRPSGRGKHIVFSPVKQHAIEHYVPVLQPAKIKTAESIEEFKAFDADVAVVVAYGRILPDDYLDAFKFGAVNVHFSLLPKYRGAAPVNWAIVNGETVTGVTTMKMDSGLDTGDVLLQVETDIREKENSADLMVRLAEIGAEVLIDTIARIDEIKPIPQDHSLATLAPMMSKQDGLIDWSMTAADIRNRIRGFQPFPTAFSYLARKRVTMWEAEIAETASENRPPGSVIAVDNGINVACGERSVLRITELQMEGKRRIDWKNFANGNRVETGLEFSSSQALDK